MEENEKLLREMLWIRHGCPITHLYGDDGEMQCSTCMIDFKRDEVKTIYYKFEAGAIQAMKRYL